MQHIELLETVQFRSVLDDQNISAVVFRQQNLLIVTDEAISGLGNIVQVLSPDGADFKALSGGHIPVDEVDAAESPEMDLEGLAVDGDTVFVLGSHSRKRKKVDPTKSYEKNRKALCGKIQPETDRDILLRLELDGANKPLKIARTSLREFLDSTEPFASFSKFASKENGVDLEGLSVWNNSVYVGCRGPVLRGNFVPILKMPLGQPLETPEILFVNLGGRGVRDLAHTEQGILILAGPSGDIPGTFQLYLWNGVDGVPGTDSPDSQHLLQLVLLGEIPIPPPKTRKNQTSAKPEGLAVDLLNSTEAAWQILIVFDGLASGHAARYRVTKPN